MLICKNVSLKSYNTFGLDCFSDTMIHVRTEKEAGALFRDELYWKKPLLIIGGGSNILFVNDYHGTILYSKFRGIRIENKKAGEVIISAGAGVVWDNLVAWCVEKGFGGLENLSNIPGMVGAAPVQNIGAYGAEVKDTIEKVRAISTSDGSVKLFSNNDCGFGYRNSVFKTSEKGRFLVTRVWFKLKSNPSFNLDYDSLKEEVNKIGPVSLRNIRQAVINIRNSKLPDPKITGNAGSFFKNPVLDRHKSERIKKEHPQIPYFDDPSGGTKFAAGWMIEQCGWKGKRLGDAGVHEKQALVLVNYGRATGMEIYDLSEKIKASVLEKFGVILEREVEIAGSI
jgi:UDP-N-acetylmuramate dehydrogenase